jgi:hypothetical protein
LREQESCAENCRKKRQMLADLLHLRAEFRDRSKESARRLA